MNGPCPQETFDKKLFNNTHKVVYRKGQKISILFFSTVRPAALVQSSLFYTPTTATTLFNRTPYYLLMWTAYRIKSTPLNTTFQALMTWHQFPPYFPLLKHNKSWCSNHTRLLGIPWVYPILPFVLIFSLPGISLPPFFPYQMIPILSWHNSMSLPLCRYPRLSQVEFGLTSFSLFPGS